MKANCGRCAKLVTKEGVECEICEGWYHCKCANVSSTTYKAIEEDKAIHWYCSGCSKGVVSIWKKLKERQEALEEEVKRVGEEVKVVKEEVGKVASMKTEMDKDKVKISKLEARVNKLAADQVTKEELNGHKADVDKALSELVEGIKTDLNKASGEHITREEFESVKEELMRVSQKAKETDVKLENTIEAKLVSVKQDVGLEVTQLKKEISQTDARMDGIVKERIDESVQEENEKRLRRANAILFGLDESEETEPAGRIAHDKEGVSDIMRSIRADGEIKQVIRLGKRLERVTGVEIKPRPLKVIFADEKSKNEVLQKARDLKTTQHAHIFIVRDMTPKEREQRKLLVVERERRKGLGEDVLIYQDKVVVRRRR